MQPKESKTSFHFWVSFVKSCVRILAAIFLIGQDLIATGLLLILAEVLGVLEEM